MPAMTASVRRRSRAPRIRGERCTANTVVNGRAALMETALHLSFNRRVVRTLSLICYYATLAQPRVSNFGDSSKQVATAA